MECLRMENLVPGHRNSPSAGEPLTAPITETVTPGMLIGLLGANGCGKSTLLCTLAGILMPMQGKVVWEEKPIHSYAPTERAKMITLLPPSEHQLPRLSVTELVALGRTPHTGIWGTLRTSDRRAVQTAISQMQLETLAQRNIQTLSDGERQKAFIAKALAAETPVILLDEPTAFLDYPTRTAFMHMLRLLAETQGKAIVVSTHDWDTAQQACHTLWVMQRGENMYAGSPKHAATTTLLHNLVEKHQSFTS